MEVPRSQPESPVQTLASYTVALDHSVPSTPVTSTAPNQVSYSTSQVEENSRSNPHLSPLASPTSYKPGKRKRLAKACDACHRSKRRCDGTAPCANCEFAGKTCSYTDPSGRSVPPPRIKGSEPRRPASGDSWSYPLLRDGSSGDIEQIPHRALSPVPTTSDAPSSALDPAITRELINLFFTHCHPATFMIHRPTLLHDLGHSKVPEYLLLSIFAVASPYSLRPRIPPNNPQKAGEAFAAQAASILFSDEQQQTGDLSESLDSLRIRPCLELAQALCLLSAHEVIMQRPSNSNRFLSLAQDILTALDIANIDISPSTMSYAVHVRSESLRRVFWYIYHVDLLLAALAQRVVPTIPDSIQQLRLPVEEALFDMPRVENRPGVDPAYDYLPMPTDHKVCRGEFANLIRVTCIYGDVITALVQKGEALQAWEQRQQASIIDLPSSAQLEVDLRKWLELLPDHLRLTEDNLQLHTSQLEGGAGQPGWAFVVSHCLAESSVLALHELANLGTEKASQGPSAREQKALDNLVMILNAMSRRARSNFLMATPLVAVGKYSLPQHPQITNWFEDYQQMWGVSYEQLMSVQFRATWITSSTTGPNKRSTSEFIQATQRLRFTSQYVGADPVLRSISSSDASSSSNSRGVPLNDFGIVGSVAYESRTQIGESAFILTRQGRTSGLGALAAAAVVDGVSLPGPSTSSSSVQRGVRGYVARRVARQGLPSIITSGLANRGMTNPRNDGRGGSEESEFHPVVDSPTVPTGSSAMLPSGMRLRAVDGTLPPQSIMLADGTTQYLVSQQFQQQGSSALSVPYGNQVVDGAVEDSDLGVDANLNW